MEQAGIPARFLNASLADFMPSASALEASTEQGYLLLGPPGCGKTHFMAALARFLITHGKRPKFVSAPEFLQSVRGQFKTDSLDVVDTLKRTTYLLLDDLGVEKQTDWVYEVWYRILEYRYSNGMYLSISANTIDSLDDRLLRRITGLTTLIEMEPR
jgi:DNA replication protein DnaC